MLAAPLALWLLALTATRPVAPAQLPARVSELREQLGTVIFDPHSDTPERRRRLAELAEADTWQVGEQRLDVGWLRDGVRSSVPETRVLTWDRLRSWEDALSPANPPAPQERVRAVAADILRGEAYQPIKAASWIDPWLPTIERILDLLLAPLKRRSAEQSGWGELLGLAAYGLLVVLMSAGLVRLARRCRPSPGRPAAVPGSKGGPAPRTAERWRAEAERHEAAADWPAAFSAYWMALLLRLDEAGRLNYAPGLTNRELAAAVGLPELVRLAELADGMAYGGATVGRAAAAECREALDRLPSPPRSV